MKKILLVALALVLGLSGAAFAIQAEIPADTTAAIAKGSTQVTIGGELRFRGAYYANTSDFSGPVTGGAGFGAAERSVFESRIRLSVEAKTSPNTKGFIQMEMAGNAIDTTGENQNWGTQNATAVKANGGTFSMGDQKIGGFAIMQAWIQHSGSGLIGVPAYIKVGHQPVVIGAGIFFKNDLYNDDAIIVGINPIKGLDMSLIAVKLNENGIASADDLNAYAAVISYAINKDIVIGTDVTYLQGQRGWSGSTANNNSTDPKIDLFNFGVNGKAKIAGLSLKSTLDVQFGKVTGGNLVRQDIFAFAATAGAAYTFAPVTVGLDFGYGSGDKSQNNKLSTFMTTQSHTMTQPGTFVYEYLTNNAAGNLSGGLQNTIYGKLSAKVDATKDVSFGATAATLWAAQRTYGGGTMATLNQAEAQSVRTNSRYIGTEFDAIASYQIDKGLKTWVEGGYLFAGDFWHGASAGYNNGLNGQGQPQKHLSNPWGARIGLQLNF